MPSFKHKTNKKIVVDKKHDNINNYTLDDIVFLDEYKSHPTIKMEMRA